MSPQRYERVSIPANISHPFKQGPWSKASEVHSTDSQQVSENDSEDTASTSEGHKASHTVPSSPPPSFRSRASSLSSRHLLSPEDPITSDAERTLADTFDDGSASDNESNDGDDRQRLMRGNPPPSADNEERPALQRAVTEFPTFPTTAPGTLATPVRVYGGGARPSSNDGVFANLSAKPEHGEKLEEQPPTYEQAAADATPPYWDNTLIAPGMSTDEVYFEGLPVGSLFSFVWNGMISMSFQYVGFLLTYLLHTTHAAKNGSRAGLGITLVQTGFGLRSSGVIPSDPSTDPSFGQPSDPNSHDFDPSSIPNDAASVAAATAMADSSSSGTLSSLASSDWFAYVLMIVGWFILIRAVSDFFKARRHEQLVLQSPDRGLNVPIVAEGERAETAV